jgi:hypothetical protein
MNGPKQKLVSVDEVSVSKLSVEIKTISVGRRQMSMGLFRQLPREALIDIDDDELRLNGMPWGRVNYHWDGCYRPPTSVHNSYEHVHVLWQRDSMLLQSPVPKVQVFGGDDLSARLAEDKRDALVSVGALVCAITTSLEITFEADNSFTVGTWTVNENWQRPLFNLLREFRAAPERKAAHHTYSKDEKRKEIEKRIHDLCRAHDVVDVPTTDDAADELYETAYAAVEAAHNARRRRCVLYAKRYQELLALEQLFIAA